ncbi:MAG TPA: EamA family transporter [Alphaproteobacteria bacterium]|nr:EamA family transporter [Alphaproteobacteria bacterium]
MKGNEVPRMGGIEWALLISLSILWGGSFFFSKVAVAAIPPLTLVLGRTGMASAVLILVLYAFGQRLPSDWTAWRRNLIMGLLNNVVPFCLIVWGQTQIESGLAAILNATTPLFTVVLAHAFTRDERLAPVKLLGVLIGLSGAVVTIGPELLEGIGRHGLAELAVIGAAISYGFAGIFGRRFKGVNPMVTAAGQLTASTAMMLPIALISDKPWQLAMPGMTVWGAWIGLAILGTSLAYILYFRILATAGATNVLLVTFLIPVSAILLGAVFLGERLDRREFVGMALIFAGLAFIDGRLLRIVWGRIRPRHRSNFGRSIG